MQVTKTVMYLFEQIIGLTSNSQTILLILDIKAAYE